MALSIRSKKGTVYQFVHGFTPSPQVFEAGYWPPEQEEALRKNKALIVEDVLLPEQVAPETEEETITGVGAPEGNDGGAGDQS